MGNKKNYLKETILQQVFNHIVPICLTSTNYEIIEANDAYWNFWGKPNLKKSPIKCFESRPGESCQTENCPLVRIINGADEYNYEPSKEHNDKLYHFIVTAKPLLDENQKLIGIIEYFQDITELRKAERIKTNLIEDLEESLKEANLLSGFLPICASCKKIRNDKGYWDRIEKYISRHSRAVFTHSICPDCAQKLYPEYFKEKKK